MTIKLHALDGHFVNLADNAKVESLKDDIFIN